MIRVVVCVSSASVKARIEKLLRPFSDIQIVDEPSDDDDADALLADSQPDVILADSGDDPEELPEAFALNVPTILLVRDPGDQAAAAFSRNVRGVLPDDLNGSQLAAAIEAVAAGLGVFDPDGVEQFPSANPVSHAPAQLPEPLTPREIEVLRAMAEGLANKEIAARLAISENTIKFHVASVMGKLGAASRTEAVMLGIRHGLVLI